MGNLVDFAGNFMRASLTNSTFKKNACLIGKSLFNFSSISVKSTLLSNILTMYRYVKHQYFYIVVSVKDFNLFSVHMFVYASSVLFLAIFYT